ncbi:MAG: hypothetical protein GXY83_22680, partial [Rhodopirellula sp.]|nr:hypothetical protein [Rhodopirellula sp.]
MDHTDIGGQNRQVANLPHGLSPLAAPNEIGDNTSAASRNSKSTSGGHLFEQTLNEASTLADSIAPAYDLIHDAKVLSADDHRAIRQSLILPMLENIAKYQAGKSNWQTWHNA